MCGITAVVALDSLSDHHVGKQGYRDAVARDVDESLKSIHHRGPDGTGLWISDDNRVALGHVRLALKDLTDTGAQPLHDRDDTVHAVVNGELYGYDALSEELATSPEGPYDFGGRSDSELIVALYKRYGISCLSKLRGEFAFVLYDSRRQLIFAGRDRHGIKPLFWTVVDNRLLIASEVKAFIPLGWRPEWDVRSIVADGWLHEETTLFRGVRKIMPAHYMLCHSFEHLQHRAYWEPEFPNKFQPEGRSEEEMILELRQHMYDAVAERMHSDVPIGAYLSGGLDSAAIVGIMADVFRKGAAKTPQQQGLVPFPCFSIGFEDNEFDEIPLAERTAAHLGVPFVARRVNEADLASNFEATTLLCEHHNPDLNSVAKYILSEVVADSGLKVVLSGEGSDEHFGGYAQFVADAFREPDLTFGGNDMTSEQRRALTAELEEKTSCGYRGMPKATQSMQSPVARSMLNDCNITSSLWAVTIAPFAPWTKTRYGAINIQETRAVGAGGRSLDLIRSQWHPLHTAQYVWTRSILPNLILTSMGDRMEMGHSIEGRTPFLDHRLVEFANALPPSLKVRIDPLSGLTREKYILREAVRPFISQEMYERKKHAFTASFRYAVGGPLHALFSRLLTRDHIEALGFVDVDAALALVPRAFAEHDAASMRAAMVVAQWVILSRAFAIPRASSGGAAPVRNGSVTTMTAMGPAGVIGGGGLQRADSVLAGQDGKMFRRVAS